MNIFHRFPSNKSSAIALSLAILAPAGGRALNVGRVTPLNVGGAPLVLPQSPIVVTAKGAHPIVPTSMVSLQGHQLPASVLPIAPAPTPIKASAKLQPKGRNKTDTITALSGIASAPAASASEQIGTTYDGRAGIKDDQTVATSVNEKPSSFAFTSLNPTDLYFYNMSPTGIKTRKHGQVIEMSVSHPGSDDVYVVRHEPGKGVEILLNGSKAPIQSVLRGLQEMLANKLERNQLRNPEYSAMLTRIRAKLAPAYVAGAPDALWRYIWAFKYSDIDTTVDYYAGFRTDTVATPHSGAIEMVAYSNGGEKLVLTWSRRSGFKLKQANGIVSSGVTYLRPHLAGLQLSLMREMLETGSRGREALMLLQKMQDALAK